MMEEVQAAKRLKVDEGGAVSGSGVEGGEPYVLPAEDVLFLTIVSRPEDVLDTNKTTKEFFCPAFTHQVFGQDEVVRGYEQCRVEVFLHASTMHAFVKTTFAGKQAKADDIAHMLDENLGLQ